MRKSYLEIVHDRIAGEMNNLSQLNFGDDFSRKAQLKSALRAGVLEVAQAAIKSTDKEMRHWRVEDMILLRSKVAESFADLATNYGVHLDPKNMNNDLRGKKDGFIIPTTDWRKRRSNLVGVLGGEVTDAFTDALARGAAQVLVVTNPKNHTKELTTRVLASGHNEAIQTRLGIDPEVIAYAIAFAGEHAQGVKETAWQKASRKIAQRAESNFYQEKIASQPLTKFQELSKAIEGK